MTGPDPDLVARFRSDLEALAGTAPERLGIAVSGGPDSLALLLLAHAACPERVHAATVDHGLRPESADEAAFVARLCQRIGVPHAILPADAAIGGNIQSGARALRYRLLAAWAAEAGIGRLLTAHHLDDQAETLVMRLLRGAGLSGLSGIRASTAMNGVAVARPLLGWRRAALERIVAAAGIAPVDDPGNSDARFDRARIRRLLADSGWIDPLPLARSAGALAEAEAALQWTAEGLWRDRVEGDARRFTLDPSGLPAELRRRLVVEVFRAMDRPAPRGEDVARLLPRLEAGEKATLADLLCTGGARWRFEPAPPRRGS